MVETSSNFSPLPSSRSPSSPQRGPPSPVFTYDPPANMESNPSTSVASGWNYTGDQMDLYCTNDTAEFQQTMMHHHHHHHHSANVVTDHTESQIHEHHHHHQLNSPSFIADSMLPMYNNSGPMPSPDGIVPHFETLHKDDPATEIDDSESTILTQKRSKVKKIILTFVKGATMPTSEASQGIGYKIQKTPPMNKTLLYEIFCKHVQVTQPLEMPSESVFWRHTLGNLYNKHEIFKNKKKMGYKGISGVRFVDPSTEMHLITQMYNKLKDVMKLTHEELVMDIRNASETLEPVFTIVKKKSILGKRKREDSDEDTLDDGSASNSTNGVNLGPSSISSDNNSSLLHSDLSSSPTHMNGYGVHDDHSVNENTGQPLMSSEISSSSNPFGSSGGVNHGLSSSSSSAMQTTSSPSNLSTEEDEETEYSPHSDHHQQQQQQQQQHHQNQMHQHHHLQHLQSQQQHLHNLQHQQQQHHLHLLSHGDENLSENDLLQQQQQQHQQHSMMHDLSIIPKIDVDHEGNGVLLSNEKPSSSSSSKSLHLKKSSYSTNNKPSSSSKHPHSLASSNGNLNVHVPPLAPSSPSTDESMSTQNGMNDHGNNNNSNGGGASASSSGGGPFSSAKVKNKKSKERSAEDNGNEHLSHSINVAGILISNEDLPHNPFRLSPKSNEDKQTTMTDDPHLHNLLFDAQRLGLSRDALDLLREPFVIDFLNQMAARSKCSHPHHSNL